MADIIITELNGIHRWTSVVPGQKLIATSDNDSPVVIIRNSLGDIMAMTALNGWLIIEASSVPDREWGRDCA